VTTIAVCEHTGITRAWCPCTDCDGYTTTPQEQEAISAAVRRETAATAPSRPRLVQRSLDQPSKPVTADARPLDRIDGQAEHWCTSCGRYPRSRDRWLCDWCAQQWTVDLRNIEPLLHDLTIAEAKRVRMTTTSTNTGGSNPLPYDTRAAEARAHLEATIAHLCFTLGITVHPWQTTVAAALLLDRHRDPSTHPSAPDLATSLRRATNRAFAVIDRPRPTQYLGACPHCGLAMHSPEGHATYTCACGQIVIVAHQLADRQAAMDDMLVTWDELLGSGVAHRATLFRWRKARRIIPKAEWMGQPMYRYGDARNARQREAG